MKIFKLKTLFPLSRFLRAAKAPTAPTGDEDGDTVFMMLDGEPVTFNQFNERMARHFAQKPSHLCPDQSDVPFRADR